MKMSEYFGFMVCELDGSIEDLHGNFDFKPKHETSGMFYAKWFLTEAERNNCKEYTEKTIREIQEGKYKGLQKKR